MGIFFLSKQDRSGYRDRIVQSLKNLNGIRKVKINYVTDKVYLEHNPEKVTQDQIKFTIQKVSEVV